MKLFKIGLMACLFLASCSSSSSSPFGGLKLAFIQNLGPNVMLPAHTATGAKLGTLSAEVQALNMGLTAGELTVAQGAWVAARMDWSRSEALMFSTLDNLGFVTRMDTWDVDFAAIEGLIADGAGPALDLAFIATQGSQFKGFHAVEYLLFSNSSGGDAPLLALQNSSRRRDYLAAVAEDLNLRMGEVLAIAQSMDADFQVATTAEASLAVDKLVNHLLLVVELMADRGLGRPLGLTKGGLPQVQGVESPYAFSSLADLQADLAGVRAVWLGSLNGSEGSGIKLIMQTTDKLDVKFVQDALDAAQTALDGISGPLDSAVGSNPTSVMDAFDAAKSLGQVIYVEMMPGIGATIFVSPFDGD